MNKQQLAAKIWAAEVGLSVRGVEKNLAQLKSAGRIRRIGGRKGGHWEVVKGA